MSIVQYTTEKPDKQPIATRQMRTNLFPTKRAILIFTAFSIILIASCERNEKFEYPTSKYWAHCVSNVDLGRKTAPLFEGLEVDMNYCEYQDKIFMGHDLRDTINGLTFEMWLDSLPQPITNRLWLDFKNLTTENATRVVEIILAATRRHGITDLIMVEQEDVEALQIVKDSGIHVILWVDNPYWSGHSEEEWEEATRQQIKMLHPDALSGDYHIFPLLPNTFPNENIHIWDTPRDYNDTNVAHSQMIASHPSVKVVLVDYPIPPDEKEK